MPVPARVTGRRLWQGKALFVLRHRLFKPLDSQTVFLIKQAPELNVPACWSAFQRSAENLDKKFAAPWPIELAQIDSLPYAQDKLAVFDGDGYRAAECRSF